MLSLFSKQTIITIAAGLLLGACGSDTIKGKKIEEQANELIPEPKRLSPIEFRNIFEKTEDFFDSALGRTGFNGAMLVAKNGTVIFERYKGYAHLNSKDTITAATPFHIASTSKTFTAMAVLKLAEDGKLNINDSLQKFFPAFPYQGITVKSLLSQRSGLPNYNYYLDDIKWDKTKRVTNADVLQTLIDFKPNLQHVPNTRFQYCNTNFALLALVIEKASGKPYPEFMDETFFKPLQMNHTKVFTWKDSATATPSYMWNGRMEQLSYLDETYGDKNIYSTVTDLLKWDQALYGNKLFKQSTLDSAFKPYSFERPGIHNYGLGWRMYTLANNKNIIYHNGWWHGNNATFYRVISEGLTIIILGNKFNRNIYHVKPLIEALTPLRFSYGNMEE